MEDKNKEIIQKDISANGLALELLQEVKTQTKQELEEQINVLQEKLKGVTNENV